MFKKSFYRTSKLKTAGPQYTMLLIVLCPEKCQGTKKKGK